MNAPSTWLRACKLLVRRAAPHAKYWGHDRVAYKLDRLHTYAYDQTSFEEILRGYFEQIQTFQDARQSTGELGWIPDWAFASKVVLVNYIASRLGVAPTHEGLEQRATWLLSEESLLDRLVIAWSIFVERTKLKSVWDIRYRDWSARYKSPPEEVEAQVQAIPLPNLDSESKFAVICIICKTLIENSYVPADTDPDAVFSKFINEPQSSVEKIRWMKTNKEFICFAEALKEIYFDPIGLNKKTSKDRMTNVVFRNALMEHFLTKDGKEFKVDSLNSEASKRDYTSDKLV